MANSDEQKKTKERKTKADMENRDPLSGEKGAHPVGVGVGTAVGGGVAGGAIGSAAAAIAGATAAGGAGAVAGPVGAAVGAIAGGIAGAYAGKSVAENINPTVEDSYWRQTYGTRPYVEKGAKYETYQPAYQYGWESRTRHAGRTFDEVEPELERDWPEARAQSDLEWPRAKPAVRDAWERIGTPPPQKKS
jgi:hypothetical protein